MKYSATCDITMQNKINIDTVKDRNSGAYDVISGGK